MRPRSVGLFYGIGPMHCMHRREFLLLSCTAEEAARCMHFAVCYYGTHETPRPKLSSLLALSLISREQQTVLYAQDR